MIPYMVGKLAPNTTHPTRGVVKCVPRRGCFRAVPSQNGDKFVTSPTPPQSLNGSISNYIWDPARGGVLEGGGPGGFTPPRHGCCVQAPDYIWDPAQGGVLEGGHYPPPARLPCPSIRLYLGPSTRGRARGGGSGGGFTPPRDGCCVQAPDYI